MNDSRRLDYWKTRRFIKDVGISVFLLAVSFVINYLAGSYATQKAGNSVEDLILDRIPRMDMTLIFVYGPTLFWIFVGALLLHKPQRIPFTLKSIALFISIRSIFITLTHLGPAFEYSPGGENFGEKLLNLFTFGGDLFFSGHTGLPFLMALAFWQRPILRIIFFAASVIFGAGVLLGHLHYSIDVFAAFFITYAIFHMAEFLFKKNRELFVHGLSEAP